MRTAGLIALTLLAGCATTPVVDAATALNGKDLQTALNLYGPWDQRIVLQGRPNYVWRRAVVLNGESYYCELRTQVGMRDTVAASIVEGYPAACALFSVQYTSTDAFRPKALPKANPAIVAASNRVREYRPVGTPTQSASAMTAAKDASARPRESAAVPGGSF